MSTQAQKIVTAEEQVARFWINKKEPLNPAELQSLGEPLTLELVQGALLLLCRHHKKNGKSGKEITCRDLLLRCRFPNEGATAGWADALMCAVSEEMIAQHRQGQFKVAVEGLAPIEKSFFSPTLIAKFGDDKVA